MGACYVVEMLGSPQSRRAMLRTLGLLAVPIEASAEKRIGKVSALLVGDSLAYQLGPRLAKALHPRGIALDGRGGTSARQWLREGWFRAAVERHPADLVLVSLGTNCIRSERPKLAEHIGALASRTLAPVIWLIPPPSGMDTSYVLRACLEAEVPHFAVGKLPMEWDAKRKREDVHPTARGHEIWAQRLRDHLAAWWPDRKG